MFRILAYGATHVGRERKNNEDAFRISPESGLYLVCDGMGGHASGEIASQIASDAMVRFISQDIHRPDVRWPIDTPNGLPEESRILDAAVRVANSEVFAAAAVNPLHKGMGTTIVGVLAGTYRLGLVHVGDSRIYRMRDGELTQLTEDHSLLNFYIQTRPMSADQIKQFAGKNVIVRAVGLRDAVEPDVQVQDYRADDVYLLCSDGVTDMVDDAAIGETLDHCGDQLAHTAEKLIDQALTGGGKDNITVVLLRVVKVPDESRTKLSARSTLPMDTDELDAPHDDLEDTSPGFDIRGDASDAETLTEIEVRQTSILRKHARTQEVPYRPWQQNELSAPPRPGVPLPYRRGIPLAVQISADVDTQAPTDPHGEPLPLGARPSHKREDLATTAKHPAVRDSQPAPGARRASESGTVTLPPEEEVTAELPVMQVPAPPLLQVRVESTPYQSGGLEPGKVSPVLVEDTERVNGQARLAEVLEAKRISQEVVAAPEAAAVVTEAAAVTAPAEGAPKAALKSTAVDKPNPRRADATTPPPVPAPPPQDRKSSPAVYIPTTPPPAPNPLTTLDENSAPEGLPLDDDEDEY